MNKKILLSLTLLIGFSAQICAFEVTSALKTTGDLLAQPGASLADAGVYIAAATLGYVIADKIVAPMQGCKAKPKFSAEMALRISGFNAGVMRALSCVSFPHVSPIIHLFAPMAGAAYAGSEMVLYATVPTLCGLVGLTIKNGFMRYITKK